MKKCTDLEIKVVYILFHMHYWLKVTIPVFKLLIKH